MDLKIFKNRYPVLLHKFLIRYGSGGTGKYRSGNRYIRDIKFRIPLQVSVLTDRCVTAPYSLKGGKEGERGQNIWVRKGPVTGATRMVSLGPRKTSHFTTGDRVIILTPGGGGYGAEQQAAKEGGSLLDKVKVNLRDARSF
ncbi:Hydantoinase B/oxoprolinase [Aspergillus spectabilis]